MSKTVLLGNVAPVELEKVSPDETAVTFTPLEIDNEFDHNNTETVVRVPDDVDLAEALITISRIWNQTAEGEPFHSLEAPAWVESDDPALAQVLASQFGCQVGRTADWEGHRQYDSLDHAVEATRLAGGIGNYNDTSPSQTGGGISVPPEDGEEWAEFFDPEEFWYKFKSEYLRVDSGKDFQAAVMGDTASNGTGTYASGTWIGLAASATAPAAGDTRATWEGAGVEIQNASGGLNRAQAAYAHTAGTTTYTLTKTFTANANDGASNTINKMAVLNAARGAGTLIFETAVSSPPVLVSGDQVTITETVNI